MLKEKSPFYDKKQTISLSYMAKCFILLLLEISKNLWRISINLDK